MQKIKWNANNIILKIDRNLMDILALAYLVHCLGVKDHKVKDFQQSPVRKKIINIQISS